LREGVPYLFCRNRSLDARTYPADTADSLA
jgi:hypothetical protein